MKKLILLLIIPVFFSCNGNDKKNENDLKATNLNGNVKSVTEFEFDVEEKFGEKVDVNLFKSRFRSYNKDGNIIEDANYWDNGSYIYKNKYDEQGNLIESAVYVDGELEGMSKYKYNEEGTNLEETRYDNDGELESLHKFKYDDKGNNIGSNIYNQEGELQFLYKNEYDEGGNQIESAQYKMPEEELDFLWKYKYDEWGNQIELARYQGEQELDFLWKYKYDEWGNRIEWASYNNNGELEYISKGTYDEMGNIIEESWDQRNSVSKKMDIRNKSYMKYLLFDDKKNWVRCETENSSEDDDWNSEKEYFKREIEYY